METLVFEDTHVPEYVYEVYEQNTGKTIGWYKTEKEMQDAIRSLERPPYNVTDYSYIRHDVS